MQLDPTKTDLGVAGHGFYDGQPALRTLFAEEFLRDLEKRKWQHNRFFQ